jgi:hypothetical protein
MKAFTSIATMASITTSYYDFEYYPNINLCVYVKNNAINYRSVSLGATFPTSDDVETYAIDWAGIAISDKLTF